MKYRVKVKKDTSDHGFLTQMGFKFDCVYFATKNDQMKYMIRGFEFEEDELIFLGDN